MTRQKLTMIFALFTMLACGAPIVPIVPGAGVSAPQYHYGYFRREFWQPVPHISQQAPRPFAVPDEWEAGRNP